jgi:CRP/FNR family cyclic AMP-dependent transcriptional regulator
MRKALRLLGLLSDSDIDWMCTQGTVRYIPAGTVLISERKAINALYIVLEGQLRVMVGGLNGKHVANLLAGEIVGEISLVDDHLPSASVIAVQASQVLALDHEKIRGKLARDQGFASRLYHSIATFLADRLYVTVTRFGYGSESQDLNTDEIPEASFDQMDLAAVRFDKMLKRLHESHTLVGAGV